MDFVNIFDNCDKLRNGITIRFMRILKTVFFFTRNCFHQLFPSESEQIHLRYIAAGNVLFIS